MRASHALGGAPWWRCLFKIEKLDKSVSVLLVVVVALMVMVLILLVGCRRKRSGTGDGLPYGGVCGGVWRVNVPC